MSNRLSVALLWIAVTMLQRSVNCQVNLYNTLLPTEGKLLIYERNQPTYIVTASRLIRPDSVYRLGISLLPGSPDMVIKAIIVNKNHQVASGSVFIDSGSSDNVIMKVPSSITDGQYRLRVEGFDPLRPQSAVFSQEEELQFNPQLLSIIVESNRAVYNKDMEVKFRVILIQMSQKPYSEPITVFILDPEGFIMRRWPSKHPTNGIVCLTYQLPHRPRAGKWTIRVEALAQVYEKHIFVESYFLKLIEILPSAPVYVLDTDESYWASVTPSHHAQQITDGDLTARIYVKGNGTSEIFKLVRKDSSSWSWDFKYQVNLKEVRQFTTQLAGSLIRVEFTIRDSFSGEERSAFIETRVIRANLKLKFAGSHTPVFKPGMPFTGYVFVMYDDNAKVPGEKLSAAKLTLKPMATLSNGHVTHLPDIIVPKQGDYLSAGNSGNKFTDWMEQQAEDNQYRSFRTSGVFRFCFTVPKEASALRVRATYQDDSGNETTSAEMQAIPYYSPQGTYVYVYSSTELGHVGESAIFHLKSDFPFTSFQYTVVSKGAIVYSAQDTLPHASRATTFAVTISHEMIPTLKVIAMVTGPFGDLIADSVTVPVQTINRYKMNITLVQNKDHSKATVQFVSRSHPGSFVGLSVLRTLNYQFQGDNTISPSVVLRSLYALEPFPKSVIGVTWTDREGLKPDESQFFLGQNPGPDARRTFDMAGVHVFTNARVGQYPDTVNCNRTAGMEPCILAGCIHVSKVCNGHPDCPDGSDEDNCPVPYDDKMEFRIFRRNRFHDFYDWMEGDWAWYDIPLTSDGEEFHDRPVPATVESWHINAFSFHPELGLAVLDHTIKYDSSPPVSFTIEVPESIRRGEILGVRLLGVNSLDRELMVIIVLEASDDYRFLEVDDYDNILIEGEHHHATNIKPMSMIEVDLAIVPQIEQGTITVKIQIISQYSHQNHKAEIEVLPEGGTIHRHTSLLLDLKNRANLLRFLDIPVEESPIIPYLRARRYIFGSPRASVTLCGDVFGPVFPSTSVSTASFLNRPRQSTESNLFNFAVTLWTLHYLRLTNQLEKGVMYEAFQTMNKEMADMMRLFHPNGSFRMHSLSKPSVWTTAWVIRILGQSQFQDWENHFFVDRKLLSTSVQWILNTQNSDGTFHETDENSLTIDRNFVSKSSASVVHTAHVLIALMKCSESLQGNVKVDAANARSRSLLYLQRKLNSLVDPYEIAIVSHALSISNSPAKETAFAKLHSVRRNNAEGMIYWSRHPVPANNVTYKNQRPFVQPRLPAQQDALAVEATAYALLVYLARDGIGDLQERVVTWLNTMRMTPAGFISVFDTMVAMEALTEYAYRARLRDIADMSIVVEASASSNTRQAIRIDSETLSSVHQLEVPNVWGHINVIGRGAGQAVMQLNVQYGIDWEDMRDVPNRPYFELYIDEVYSDNKPRINVTACAKWLALDLSPHSATTILEIETPSGYHMVQTDADEVVKKREFSFLHDVFVAKNKVVWVIDKLGDERTCFHYELQRWYPVANMSLYRSALIYESYSPDHFEMVIFNATFLYVLDVCEVCGSYQCDDCPFYSVAPRRVAINFVLLCCLCLQMLISFIEFQ